MTEIEKSAIAQIRKRHPNAQTRGFYPAVRETLWRRIFVQAKEINSNPDPDDPPPTQQELRELWEERKPGFMPDLFEFDKLTKELRLYEIEDTHPLTDKKLYTIADFWGSVDDETSWNVRLLVTDRYGLNEREIALPDAYFQMLGGDSSDSATQQIARESGIDLSKR